MPKQKCVRVVWFDCTYCDGQYTAKAAMDENLVVMDTVGHLIGEDKIKVVVAEEFVRERKSYRRVSWIPKVNIIKRKYLK